MKLDPSLLQTGWLLMAGGLLLNYLRTIPLMVKEFFLRWFTIRVECPDHDMTYGIALNAISKLRPIGGVRDASLKREVDYDGEVTWRKPPAPGVHFYWYKRRLIQVYRYRKELTQMSNSGKSLYENLAVRFYFTNHDFVDKFFSDADEQMSTFSKINLTIRCYATNQHYEIYRSRRGLHSIHLATGVKERIVDDITEFVDSRRRYESIGVPYRRGYLLHGPPGNGKTSIIKAVASEFEHPINIINLNAKNFDDDSLHFIFTKILPKSIILLEDVDCLFDGRENAKSKVTLSGLLNALDGVASTEGYLLFMTTNHPEKLDPALTRPGRVDVQIEINNVVREQAVRYFSHFYGPGHEVLAEKFGQRYFTDEPSQVSMAQLQNHLLLHKNNPEEAVTYFS